jgi:hypothetical protein
LLTVAAAGVDAEFAHLGHEQAARNFSVLYSLVQTGERRATLGGTDCFYEFSADLDCDIIQLSQDNWWENMTDYNGPMTEWFVCALDPTYGWC